MLGTEELVQPKRVQEENDLFPLLYCPVVKIKVTQSPDLVV